MTNDELVGGGVDFEQFVEAFVNRKFRLNGTKSPIFSTPFF
jgi:hypothetical protein